MTEPDRNSVMGDDLNLPGARAPASTAMPNSARPDRLSGKDLTGHSNQEDKKPLHDPIHAINVEFGLEEENFFTKAEESSLVGPFSQV